MVICPKCSAIIDYLLNWCVAEQEWQAYKFSLSEGHRNYKPVKIFRYIDAQDIYECPRCYAVLFTNAEEAERFLKS